MEKWWSLQSGEDILKAITAKRFIQIFYIAEPIDKFDVDLYFKLVEKIMVNDAGRLIVSLFDGSEMNVKLNRDRKGYGIGG